MRVKQLLIAAFLVCVTLVFSGCTALDPEKTIMVGASPTPHADILRACAPELEKEGYTLDVIEFNDYIQPNIAVATGELDANFFQHITFLQEFNEQQGANLTSATEVHFEPFGLYAGKTASLEGLSDGSTIAIPNDTTNEGRALALLEQAGLITLAEDAGLEATVLDIAENPKHLRIQEIEAAQLPLVLGDVDMAAINGNYALGAGLSPEEALVVEDDASAAAAAYANVLVVQAGHEGDPKIQALVHALTSPEVRTYIEETYHGGVVPLF